MNIKAHVAALEAHALKHYDEGGHWVYETHNTEDYVQFLSEANWDLGVAMQRMVSYWRLVDNKAKDCAWE
jgi:hypothetical protein